MGIIINQSLRNAIISYIGIAIGFVTTIQLYPNILNADQFGLTRVLIAIMTISVQIINFGVPNSIIKYFPELSLKSKNKPGLLWAFMLPPFVGFFIYTIIIFFFEGLILTYYDSGSDLLSNYFLYIIPLVAFSVAFSLLNAFIKAQFNTVFASFLQDVALRILMIIDLALFYFGVINFDVFILIFVGNYAIQYFLLIVYALKNKLLSLKPDFSVFDRSMLQRIKSYSFFSYFSGLTMLIIGNIDLLMVGTYNGLASSGIYAIALYVGSVILIPKKSIVKISFPVIANSFQRNDLDNVQKVYQQTSLNQFLTGFLLYIGILANLDNLYAMLPEEYANGSIVIMIIGLGNLIEMVTGANGQIIIASKYYRFDFYSSWVLIFFAVVLNVLLIPEFGIAGASLATASSILLYNSAKILFVWTKLNMQPFSFRLIGILLTGLIILFLSSIFPGFKNIYLDILVRSLLMAILYIASIWFFNLSDEINQFLKRNWNEYFN